MRKNIKYSASFIIIVLSLVLGLKAYAEDDASVGVDANLNVGTGTNNVSGEGRGEVRVKVQGLKDDIKANIEANKEKRGEMRKEVEDVRGEVKTLRDENKLKLDAMISGVKEKREAFKVDLEAKKVEVKAKVDEMRAKFKESLAKVKDENKQTIAINISDTLASLNVKLTTELSLKVDQIENVLVSIQSRITKAEGNGVDVTTAKAQVEKAKIAIDSARTAITTQSGKTYETTITSEATLKAQMKTLRDSFKKDIKVANDAVKQAHIAVKTIATTLVKIPKIDEEVSATATTSTTVEDNNTNNQ